MPRPRSSEQMFWSLTPENRQPIVPGKVSTYSSPLSVFPSEAIKYLATRSYQLPTIGEVLTQLQSTSRARIVVGAPTGAGKGTIIAYLLLALSLGRRVRVLVVSPREEISDRLYRDIERVGLHHAVSRCHGRNNGEGSAIVVGNIQTVLGRLPRLGRFDIVLLDEVHHFTGNTWATLIERLGNAHAIGFTATTARQDGKVLGDVFERLIVGVNYSTLLGEGHIVPCTVLTPRPFLNGDLACSVVDAYQRFARGRPTLVYERSVSAALETTAALQAAGVRASAVVQDTVGRKKLLERFEQGHCDVLVSFEVLTEGVDLPSAEVIILARPILFESRFRQIVGRILRAAPEKLGAQLVDLTGCAALHLHPNSDYDYALNQTAEDDRIKVPATYEEREQSEGKAPPNVLNCELYDEDDNVIQYVSHKDLDAGYTAAQKAYASELRLLVSRKQLFPSTAKNKFKFRFPRASDLLL